MRYVERYINGRITNEIEKNNKPIEFNILVLGGFDKSSDFYDLMYKYGFTLMQKTKNSRKYFKDKVVFKVDYNTSNEKHPDCVIESDRSFEEFNRDVANFLRSYCKKQTYYEVFFDKYYFVNEVILNSLEYQVRQSKYYAMLGKDKNGIYDRNREGKENYGIYESEIEAQMKCEMYNEQLLATKRIELEYKRSLLSRLENNR